MTPLEQHNPLSSTKSQYEPVAGSSQTPITWVEPDESATLKNDMKDPLWCSTSPQTSGDALPIRKRSLSPASRSSSTQRKTIKKGRTEKTVSKKTQSTALKIQHNAMEKARRERINGLLNELKATLSPTTEGMSEREILEESIAFVRRTRHPTTERAQTKTVKASKSALKTEKTSGSAHNKNVTEQQRRQVITNLTKELEALLFPNSLTPVGKEKVLLACLGYIRHQKSASAMPERLTQQVNELADMLGIPESADRTSEALRQCKQVLEEQSLKKLMKTAKERLEQHDQSDADTLLLAIACEGNKQTELRPLIEASQQNIYQCDWLLRTTLDQLQTNNSEIKKQLLSLTKLYGKGKAKDQSSAVFDRQENALATLKTALEQKNTLSEQYIELVKKRTAIETEINRLQQKLLTIEERIKSTDLNQSLWTPSQASKITL